MPSFSPQSLYRCCMPFVILVSTLGSSCSTAEPTGDVSTVSTPANQEKGTSEEVAVATFGAGCFWCVEAVFEELEGVLDVNSGYAGGAVDNPSYKEVCTGLTGHAEVCQIQYDSGNISYGELLEVFWKTHDPTTLNQQGHDVGTQYRSVIFYHNAEQKELAEEYKQKLDASGAWDNPLVTEISPIPKYYPAEDYHQNYFKLNPNQSYCSFVIRPKLKKFKNVFADKLKQKDR